MSVVTDLIVQFDPISDETHTTTVRALCAAHGYVTPLRELTDCATSAWGGNKAPQSNLYAGAFNHLDVDGFILAIARIPWRAPECVRIFVQRENSMAMGVWVVRDGQPVNVLAEVEGD